MALLATCKPYNSSRFLKIEDSGELMYLGCSSPKVRPPKPITLPCTLKIGNMIGNKSPDVYVEGIQTSRDLKGTQLLVSTIIDGAGLLQNATTENPRY